MARISPLVVLPPAIFAGMDYSDINLVRVGVNRKFDLWGLLTGTK